MLEINETAQWIQKRMSGLTEEEMRPLGIHSESVQIDFAEGDSVVVIGGVWN